MDLLDSATSYAAGVSILLLIAAFLLLQPTGLVKWLQKKNYQYEVTFALYMLTPTEKFIFNSILFLTLSMFTIATIVYLPDHIMTMSRRAYYYCAGDAALLFSSRHAAETLYGTATRAGDAVLSAATGWAHNAYQAAMNRTAVTVVQEVAGQAAEVLAEA